MDDSQYVLAKYTHPNIGQHVVMGVATQTKYGYRGGGEIFLVHKQDIAAQPHLFEVIPSEPLPIPQPSPVAPPPPVQIEAAEVVPVAAKKPKAKAKAKA
jgi:hypothetical protein